MPASFGTFGATPADVLSLLPWVSAADLDPDRGHDEDAGLEYLEELLARQAVIVAGLLPQRYRALLRRIEGEVIVEEFEDGDILAVGVACAKDTPVRLYRNFGYPEFSLRRSEDLWCTATVAEDGTTLALPEGASPSSAEVGDWVVAEYVSTFPEGLTLPAKLTTAFAVYAVAAAQAGIPEDRKAEVDAVKGEALLLLEGLARVKSSDGAAPPAEVFELSNLRLWDDWDGSATRVKGPDSPDFFGSVTLGRDS